MGEYMSSPHCSGKLIVVNAVSYGCQQAKDRGKTVCQGFLLNRKRLENKLLNSLKNNLLTKNDVIERLDEVVGSEPEKAKEVVKNIFGDIQIELRDKKV